MPLKLVKRPKTPFYVMRGTVRGQSIEETTGTTDLKAAEYLCAVRNKELLDESIYGKEFTKTFPMAMLHYVEHGGEKRYAKRLLDHFGERPLRTIGQEEIDKAALTLLPNASWATRNRQVYTPMSAILRHAAKRGWRAELDLERPQIDEKEIRWIYPHEAERLIASCGAHLRSLVIFLLYTGARTGEALWLDWKYVDLDFLKQVTFAKTKNGEARSVPLHPRIIEELERIENRQGPVFLTHRGKPYSRPDPEDDKDTSAGSRIKNAFRGACGRAGISNFTPHCCRHTWATWHYQRNRDITALQKLGGWKSIAMVMRYAHTNTQEHAQSIENLPWGKSGDDSIATVISSL